MPCRAFARARALPFLRKRNRIAFGVRNASGRPDSRIRTSRTRRRYVCRRVKEETIHALWLRARAIL